MRTALLTLGVVAAVVLFVVDLRNEAPAPTSSEPVRAYTALVSIPKGTRLSQRQRGAFALTYRFDNPDGVLALTPPTQGVVATRTIRGGEPYRVGDVRP